MYKKKSKFSSVFGFVLLLIFLAAAIAGIVFLERDLKGDGKSGLGGILGNVMGKESFSVEYNGKTLSDGDNIVLPDSGYARFDVKTDGGYNVKVLPNVTPETDFNFYAYGSAHSYIKEDFTSYFINSVNLRNDYFTFSCAYEVNTVWAVLYRYYATDTLSVLEIPVEYPFRLVVTSVESGKTLSFGMKQFNREKSISFDFDGDIVF